jgi:hypothetical protein
MWHCPHNYPQLIAQAPELSRVAPIGDQNQGDLWMDQEQSDLRELGNFPRPFCIKDIISTKGPFGGVDIVDLNAILHRLGCVWVQEASDA